MKQPHYRYKDLNRLNRSVVHTYHPQIIESNNVQYQDLKQIKQPFEAIHIDPYNDPVFNNFVCHVQPSQKFAPRVF